MDPVLGKIVYWAAVVAISLALVVLLILFFESRDESQIENGAVLVGVSLGARPASRGARSGRTRRSAERRCRGGGRRSR